MKDVRAVGVSLVGPSTDRSAREHRGRLQGGCLASSPGAFALSHSRPPIDCQGCKKQVDVQGASWAVGLEDVLPNDSALCSCTNCEDVSTVWVMAIASGTRGCTPEPCGRHHPQWRCGSRRGGLVTAAPGPHPARQCEALSVHAGARASSTLHTSRCSRADSASARSMNRAWPAASISCAPSTVSTTQGAQISTHARSITTHLFRRVRRRLATCPCSACSAQQEFDLHRACHMMQQKRACSGGLTQRPSCPGFSTIEPPCVLCWLLSAMAPVQTV